MPPPCTVPGCGKPRRRNSSPFCDAHYSRWLRHGHPLVVKKTPPGKPLRYLRETVLSYEGDACLPWPFRRGASGYGQIVFRGRHRPVSNVVCELAHGPAPSPTHQAAHGCGNGHLGCVNKRHLRWATPAENAADKILHGRAPIGESNPRAKLTAAKVRAIRLDRRPASVVASAYGISRQVIWNIRTLKGWRHVD